MYSDISSLIIAFSSPNKLSANAFDNSVFPTPVGPKNKNEPIGLFGAFKPTLLLLIAFATASTASFCPITLLCNVFSRFFNLTFSSSVILFAGIPVQLLITSAIFSSVMFISSLLLLFFHFFCSFSYFSFNSFCLSLNDAAFSNF